jgi:tetrahydromethanopterin S-methyltransferase subunit G
MSASIILEGGVLAEEDESVGVAEEQALDIQRIKQRLDMLDQRLDNIDSMVTAVAERVMSQLITINITCPHCGKDIEVAMVGSQKPTR